jgi:hypothetical protein
LNKKQAKIPDRAPLIVAAGTPPPLHTFSFAAKELLDKSL